MATGYYSNESTQNITTQVQWTVTGSAGGTISQAGYYQPSSAGSATIYATSGNTNGSTTLNIP